MSNHAEPLTLDGKVAVVTGAGRGLGRSHAMALAERGAHVVVNDPGASMGGEGQSDGPASEVTAEIRAAGGEAVADTTDISSVEGAQALIDTAVSTYGRVDIVINNAGILHDGVFHKLSPEYVRQVIDVHLYGTLWVTRAAWPLMREQGGGRIVNTTSVAGYLGNFGQVNYSAAKAGIIGLTHTLALEGARHHIAVNAVAPGARTRMTENILGDLAERLDPSHVSSAVVWLCHEACTATGQVFMVAGGRMARVLSAQTQGWFSTRLSPEEIRDHWDEINDVTDLAMPANVAEELELVMRHLREPQS